MFSLTNNSAVWVERPVNEKAAPHQILLRHRSPVAAVVAVVAVISHGEVGMNRHDKGPIGRGQEIAAEAVPSIGILGPDDPLKTVGVLPSRAVIDEQAWRLNTERVPGQAGQPLNVERLTGFRVSLDARDIIRAENKNVAPTRLDDVVGELVDKNLVARVDGAARDHLVFVVTPAGKNVEIGPQGLGRRINQECLVLQDHARKREEEEKLFRGDLQNLVLLRGNNVDVIASAGDKIEGSPHQVRRRTFARITDNAVERRLHRARGNLEGLEKIGANSHGHDDGHKDDLAVFPPMRFPGDGRELVQMGVERFRAALDLCAIALMQGRLQAAHPRGDLFALGFVEHVGFVTQELLRVPQQQLAMFDVSRGKHGRPLGGAHPYTHLWDNGKEPADELNRVMEIRTVAMRNFGENNIKPGAPMATLEEVFVPMYFFHRYQTEATAKVVGGLNYRYAVRGDGQPVAELLTPQQELNALEALLKTVQPSTLMLPENLLRIIPPRPLGYVRHRELIKIRTELTFDPLSAAETAADLTFSLILHPARTNRLFEHHSRDARLPSLESVIDKMTSATIKQIPKPGYEGAVQMAIDHALFTNLTKLALNKDAAAPSKAITMMKLEQLKSWLSAKAATTPDEEWKAFYIYLLGQIVKLQTNPEEYKQENLLVTPPGQPIGDYDHDFCRN